MSGELSPENLVSLPRLDATAAAALGEALYSEASHIKKLPASIASAVKPLGKALEVLHEALRGRLDVAAPTTPGKRAADLNEDTAVSTLYDWLSALARLPAGMPEGEQARQWIAELFPDGVSFLKLPYAKEWAEVEARLSKIKLNGYDKPMQELGGRPFLTFVNKAHKVYGETLGITSARPDAEAKDTAALRDAWQGQLQAIRFYVLRVLSHIEPEDQATSALAARLLRPLTEWKSRSVKATAAPPPPATPSSPPA